MGFYLNKVEYSLFCLGFFIEYISNMNAGMRMVKYLLFAFNFIFVIFGFVLIGVGAVVEILYREVVSISSNAISVAPILMVVIGVMMLLIAFFGCCGAYKESYCMVTCFSVLLTLIFILELTATLSAYILRSNVEHYITDSFNTTVMNYDDHVENPFAFIQQKFKCCGVSTPDDYKESTMFAEQAAKLIADLKLNETRAIPVPDSCCVEEKIDCGLMNTTEVFQAGRVQTIEASIKEEILVVGGVGLAVTFIQLTGIGFACLLMRSIKTNYEVVQLLIGSHYVLVHMHTHTHTYTRKYTHINTYMQRRISCTYSFTIHPSIHPPRFKLVQLVSLTSELGAIYCLFCQKVTTLESLKALYH